MEHEFRHMADPLPARLQLHSLHDDPDGLAGSLRFDPDQDRVGSHEKQRETWPK